MKERWLNMILLLSNRIYSKKQSILNDEGWKIGKDVLLLVLFQIFLALLSLPLYLSVKPVGLAAFVKDTAKYTRVIADYSLRRILTLTGVGAFLIIWALKLSFIVALPNFYGPLRLYEVVNLRPADILNSDLVATETGLQTARVLPAMAIPTLKGVKKVNGGDYIFFGSATPLSTVALLLSGNQTAVYSASANKNGEWEIKHAQDSFRLAEGNHSILIFQYDQKNSARSQAAPEQYFKVTVSVWDKIINSVDTIANWSLVIILVLGVFLTILTL